MFVFMIDSTTHSITLCLPYEYLTKKIETTNFPRYYLLVTEH